MNKRGMTPGGWPWNDPANAFAKKYEFGLGALPSCDDLAARSALLTIASCLHGADVADIVAAFKKVAVGL